jgi:hypothetical protein
MKTLELSEAVEPLASYAQAAAEEPVIVTVAGQPYVALVTADRLSAAGEYISSPSSNGSYPHHMQPNHHVKRHALRQAAQRKLQQEEREFEAEVESLSNNPRFIVLMEEAERELREHGGYTSEELRREFGLD